MTLRFRTPRRDDLYAAPELASLAILEAAAAVAVAALLAVHPDDHDLHDDPLPPDRRAAWALADAARDLGSAINRYRLALVLARERDDILPF
jgi:hypothetical protein